MAATAATMPASPFEDFQTVGTDIFFYQNSTPTSREARTDSTSPSLVVFCTWLGGATDRRIQKYLDKYRRIFPTSSILVIKTKMLDITLNSPQTIRARLAPARDIIQRVCAQQSDSEGERNVLLHIFSIGGLNIAIQLAKSMRAFDIPFPLGGIILDSCPGDAEWKRSYNAAAVSLPTLPIMNFVGKIALYPALGIILGIQNWGFRQSVGQMRAELNDPDVFGQEVWRLYLYSKEDIAITTELIKSHRDEACAKGIPVRSLRFDHGAHCGLIVDNDELYGAFISSFWRNKLAATPVADVLPTIESGENPRPPDALPPPAVRSKL